MCTLQVQGWEKTHTIIILILSFSKSEVEGHKKPFDPKRFFSVRSQLAMALYSQAKVSHFLKGGRTELARSKSSSLIITRNEQANPSA